MIDDGIDGEGRNSMSWINRKSGREGCKGARKKEKGRKESEKDGCLYTHQYR